MINPCFSGSTDPWNYCLFWRETVAKAAILQSAEASYFPAKRDTGTIMNVFRLKNFQIQGKGCDDNENNTFNFLLVRALITRQLSKGWLDIPINLSLDQSLVLSCIFSTAFLLQHRGADKLLCLGRLQK